LTGPKNQLTNCLREAGAGGSNPLTPTSTFIHILNCSLLRGHPVVSRPDNRRCPRHHDHPRDRILQFIRIRVPGYNRSTLIPLPNAYQSKNNKSGELPEKQDGGNMIELSWHLSTSHFRERHPISGGN
jgi:hypothetical protein